jgi:dTDP-glucose 4,6-dehydratase
MRKGIHKILITGGAGFIGSAFVRLLGRRGLIPVVVDKLTYAGDFKRLKEAKGRYRFYKTDICDRKKIDAIFRKERPGIVVHFAAESHVDRSINDATPFIETNIKGTQVLIDVSRKYKVKKFIFISTDEVYGEIAKGKFSENSPLKPNSPYAASKAAADLLVQSYVRTYNFPALIIRPCNNYGPWQFPEKLIPLGIFKVLTGRNVPVYGKGLNVREWLYVEDCAKGILALTKKCATGEVYNLGSGMESRNIDTVKLLLKALNVRADRFEFVKDRPGHDWRYSLDSRKAYKEAGWKPGIGLEPGIRRTVNWCLKNKNWLIKKG